VQAQARLEVKILTELEGNTLLLKASALNGGQDKLSDLTYEFKVARTDANGNRSNNQQGGVFSLPAGEQSTLSTLRINLGKRVELDAVLTVRDQEQHIIAQDKLKLPQKTNSDSPRSGAIQQPDAGQSHALDIELDGIFLLDNTRTRAGHDLYDLLYQLIGQRDIPGSFQIVLEELPGQGLSSTIQIYLNGQLVFTNPLRPKYDLLVEIASYSGQLLLERMQHYEQFQENLEGGTGEAY